MKYCRNLRLAGYSGWRLATLGELAGIYDKSAEAPGENLRSPWHEAEPMTFHVKGGLFLTGWEWSSNLRSEHSGYGWYVNFNEGRADDSDELGFETNKHALCVRNDLDR